MRVGDEIWIIPSSSTLIVLWKLSPMTYCVVGEAYVHGIMQVEALEGVFQWEKVNIALIKLKFDLV